MNFNEIYVLSDTHISHDNIIKYCNRPFSSLREMDETIFRNWNDVVKDGDIVLHCGDFSIKSKPNGLPQGALQNIASLKGHKILIKGNHDKTKMVEYLRSLNWIIVPKIELENELLIIHNPSDPQAIPYKGGNRYLVHGHTHGSLGPNTEHRIDCGVDSLEGYRPYRLRDFIPEDLYRKLALKAVDLVADTNGCLGCIFNTMIVCGEEGNFCSDRCLNAK